MILWCDSGVSIDISSGLEPLEYGQRVIIWFLCKECVSREDIYAHLEAQFGGAAYSRRSIRWWCRHVRQGLEDLHDEVRSGRPPIDFLDIRSSSAPIGLWPLLIDPLCHILSITRT
jgi:hypothetical protein